MNRHRLRIRFRKSGDLRLISHRDLARAWERLFRRAQLSLSMSEGFHPHPRINFPSALAVGIESEAEVVEVQLNEAADAETVRQRLVEHSPPGLVIMEVRAIAPEHPKPVVEQMAYEIPIPPERRESLQAALVQLQGSSHFPVAREGREEPIDVRAAILDCRLLDDRLQFRLSASREAQARPREVLTALGVEDLELQGFWLTRTQLVLTDERTEIQGVAR